MLPAQPPEVTSGDFDPATYNLDAEDDASMEVDDEESTVDLSSVEINILIYLYLLESNFSHTAFTLLSESRLPDTSLFQYFNPSFGSSASSKPKANGTPGIGKSPKDGLFGRAEGKIPRGELIRKLWKALRWEEIERHVTSSGEPYQPPCRNPFRLIVPHICPPGYPSATKNPKTPLPPSFRVSPPPPPLEEAFPPEENEEETLAGPSKASREQAPPTVGKGKRKTRRNSNDSMRQPSPTRAASPTTTDRRREKEKKRPRAERDLPERPASRAGKGKERADDGAVETEQSSRKPAANGESSPSNKRSRLSVDDKEVDDQRVRSPLIQQSDLEEEPEEEAEEVEEKDEDSKEVREIKKGETEHRSRPTWIGDANVTILQDHRDVVTDVAWNPMNREVLATASNDGNARLWEFRPQENGSEAVELARESTLIPHKSIESNKKAVTAAVWHPDGSVLATASHDGTGRLFTPSGQLQGIMNYGRGAITALKFSPSGARILTAKTDFTVTLWSIGRSHEQRMVQNFSSHGAEVNDVEWLDEHVFASCGNDRKIFIYRTNDKVSRFTFGSHTDDITRLAWQPPREGLAPEDRKLASASDDGSVKLWLLPRYPKDRGTVSRSASPNKSARDEDEEEEYEFDDSKSKRRCVGTIQVVDESENKRMDQIKWSPDGKYLAAGGQDTTVKIYNAETCELHFALKGLEEGIGSIAFSPLAMGLVAGGGWHARIFLWDYVTGEVRAEYEYDEMVGKQRPRDKPMNLAMQWRDDGNQLAVALANKKLLVLHTGDLKAGKA